MKKTLFTCLCLSMLSLNLSAQNESGSFDKKYRFGLRVAAQPSWFSSGDKNNIPNGSIFGFGFGLNMEYRFSEIAALLTGIGGDFEGGKYKFKSDTANSYQVSYWMDESGALVAPKAGKKPDNTVYVLSARTVKTTFATIPVILKMSTREYNGFKYFGMFGGEIGIRLKSTATDTYDKINKYSNDLTFKTISAVQTTESGVDIGSDGSLIPIRLGLNVGFGTEYRIAGSTSLFMSVNFFKSGTNLMKKESDYMYYRTDMGTGGESYKMVKQNLRQTAVRINIGIMF